MNQTLAVAITFVSLFFAGSQANAKMNKIDFENIVSKVFDDSNSLCYVKILERKTMSGASLCLGRGKYEHPYKDDAESMIAIFNTFSNPEGALESFLNIHLKVAQDRIQRLSKMGLKNSSLSEESEYIVSFEKFWQNAISSAKSLCDAIKIKIDRITYQVKPVRYIGPQDNLEGLGLRQAKSLALWHSKERDEAALNLVTELIKIYGKIADLNTEASKANCAIN